MDQPSMLMVWSPMSIFLKALSVALSALSESSADTKLISYGQEVSGMDDETVQAGIEWVFLSLLAVGYRGQGHLFWLNSERDEEILKMQRKLIRK
ncbi:hypothetical protein H6F89_31320 [Cyanobacteria bacterium FACHB-63]|nr:hypothetical protein [Cyanobacteria bacterium FACHB-63]